MNTQQVRLIEEKYKRHPIPGCGAPSLVDALKEAVGMTDKSHDHMQTDDSYREDCELCQFQKRYKGLNDDESWRELILEGCSAEVCDRCSAFGFTYVLKGVEGGSFCEACSKSLVEELGHNDG